MTSTRPSGEPVSGPRRMSERELSFRPILVERDWGMSPHVPGSDRISELTDRHMWEQERDEDPSESSTGNRSSIRDSPDVHHLWNHCPLNSKGKNSSPPVRCIG